MTQRERTIAALAESTVKYRRTRYVLSLKLTCFLNPGLKDILIRIGLVACNVGSHVRKYIMMQQFNFLASIYHRY